MKGSDHLNDRHEWKHEISLADMYVLRQRLRAVMQPDPHAVDGKYFIRSLYFDDPTDRALREKLDGINRRDKFRIRCYNHNPSLIHLEKKSKENGICRKASTELTAQETQWIIDGNLDWMRNSGRPLLHELYSKMQTQLLQPKTIVDYMREPFVYGPGNVRVTLDYDIRTGLRSTDFLNPNCVTIPVEDNPIILEVKWDAFLPSVIRDIVQLEGRHTAAFSKYAACRNFD